VIERNRVVDGATGGRAVYLSHPVGLGSNREVAVLLRSDAALTDSVSVRIRRPHAASTALRMRCFDQLCHVARRAANESSSLAITPPSFTSSVPMMINHTVRQSVRPSARRAATWGRRNIYAEFRGYPSLEFGEEAYVTRTRPLPADDVVPLGRKAI